MHALQQALGVFECAAVPFNAQTLVSQARDDVEVHVGYGLMGAFPVVLQHVVVFGARGGQHGTGDPRQRSAQCCGRFVGELVALELAGIVSLAAAVSATSVRLGIGGVAATPTIREWPIADLGLDDAAKADTGEADAAKGDDTNRDDAKLDDALNAFAWDLGGSDDIHATAQYRRQLVRRLGKRTIMEARKCRN